VQRLVTGMDGFFNEAARVVPVVPGGRFSLAHLPLGTYRIQYGKQSEDLVLSRPDGTLELAFDPDATLGCEDCGPEPFDPATYTGAWLPAFEQYDGLIQGPRSDAAMAAMVPGVLPGDVLEQSDGKPGAAGLEGKRDTPVRLRLFRPGTGAHLDVTVKRTAPAID
jgi:hypothetical protein